MHQPLRGWSDCAANHRIGRNHYRVGHQHFNWHQLTGPHASEVDITFSVASQLVDVLCAAHTDVTTTEECAICGESMLRAMDVSNFNKGDVLEPDRRELRGCLSGHAAVGRICCSVLQSSDSEKKLSVCVKETSQICFRNETINERLSSWL